MVRRSMATVCLLLVEVMMAGLITGTDGQDGDKAGPRKCAQLVSFCLSLGI